MSRIVRRYVPIAALALALAIVLVLLPRGGRGGEPELGSPGDRPVVEMDPVIPSSRVESRAFTSATLGRTMPYIAYLPPGYDTESARRFPVLYMLHGLSGRDDEWVWYGLFEQADELIATGQIQPMIIVLPQGDDSYWADHAGGGPRWGYYTAHDVVGEIDARYRTVADRDHRGLGGLSMGADGALQLAINYSAVFRIAIANSPVLRRYDIAPPFFGDPAWFAAHDPLSLYRAHADIARSVRIWIDTGFDDVWRPGVEALHQQMLADGIEHSWHEYPGGHEGAYWTARVPDDLRFFDEFLRKP